MNREFEIIIHRAHNSEHGENSLAGIEEIRVLGEDFMIEADICVTADNVPILFHDLTFDRMCGVPGIVAETEWEDLPDRNDSEPIARLDEILEAFPDQRFIFDLRTHVHEDLLRQSSYSKSDLQPTSRRVIAAVRTLVTDNRAGQIRIAVAEKEHREPVRAAFSKFEVDIFEQYTRRFLDQLPGAPTEKILGPDLKRLYIRFREIRPDIIDWAHGRGLKIIGNHSPSQRSLESSLMMLKKCMEWGMDGLTTSPIDAKFIKTWLGQ